MKKTSARISRTRKVLVVGNVFFGRQIAEAIEQHCKTLHFHVFETKRKKDILRYLFHLPTADLVFSVSATVKGGGALRVARRLGKPILQEFIGCDTTQAIEDLRAGKADQHLIRSSTFFSGAPWLTNELAAAGLSAEYASDYVVGIPETPSPLPERFSVLSYVGDYNEGLYGMDVILASARSLPQVPFRIAGIDKSKFELPPNVKLLGWTNEMQKEISNSTVFLRLTRHDGMGHSVIEALGLGRWVIRTNEMPGTIKASSTKDVINSIKMLSERFKNRELKENLEGHAYAQKSFNKDSVIRKLTEIVERATKLEPV